MKIDSFSIQSLAEKHFIDVDGFTKQARKSWHKMKKDRDYTRLYNGVVIIQVQGDLGTFRGLIAQVDLSDYANGNIRRHEHILEARLKTSMALIAERRALIKPTILTYETVEKIDAIQAHHVSVHEPELTLQFSKNNEIRKYWCLAEHSKVCRSLIEEFRQIESMYIADGHHRFAAAFSLHHESGYPDFMLGGLFSFNQLKILDYNRIAKLPPHLSPDDVLHKIREYAAVTFLKDSVEGIKPKQKYSFTFYIDGTWYQATWHPTLLKDIEKSESVVLDAFLLNHFILDKVLAIRDAKTDDRIQYISSALSANNTEEKVKHDQIAFILYPIGIDEMVEVVQANEVLPPKSTWFEPRMHNGIISTPWDRD